MDLKTAVIYVPKNGKIPMSKSWANQIPWPTHPLLLRGLDPAIPRELDKLAVVPISNRDPVSRHVMAWCEDHARELRLAVFHDDDGDMEWDDLPIFEGRFLCRLDPIDDFAHLDRLVFVKDDWMF